MQVPVRGGKSGREGRVLFINRINVIISDDDGESLVVSPLSYIDKEDGVSRFCGNVRIDKPGLYWYRFELDTELGIFFKRKGESEDYQLTVYPRSKAARSITSSSTGFARAKT